jgi:hypothetical protein
VTKFLAPKSKFSKGYGARLKLQKIPVGESFTIEVTDAVGLDVNVDDSDIAQSEEILSAIGNPKSLFFQVSVVGTGTTKLVVRNPGSPAPLDFLTVKALPKVTRTEDLIYSGSRLTWFRDDGTSGSFRATSGLGTGFQHAAQQRSIHGSIPEGRYSFLAQRDAENGGVATVDSRGDLDSREGLQFVPHFKNLRIAWGLHRVRLTPLTTLPPARTGGFYLHDSRKGFTHGCVETEDNFFKMLFAFVDSHQKNAKTRLILKVTYASEIAAATGGTSDTRSETGSAGGSVSGTRSR